MIFLDLHKAHDGLDRYICLDILEVHGVGPPSRQLLHMYWDHLNMVSCAGGY